MTLKITIDVDSAGSVIQDGASPAPSDHGLADRVAALEGKHHQLIRQMGDEISAFPRAKMGGYISHFRIVIEVDIPGAATHVVSIVSPPAAQSVAWGDPFIYRGPEANHAIKVPLPLGSKLSDTISEGDFLEKPGQFFIRGRETIWLQILNLDATMDSSLGKIRIILGETLKREYPDLFKPSLGVAQALGDSGFPATLFFNPYAIIETPVGKFRAVHGTLSYGRVTAFPPVGTPVSISSCIPLEEINSVRSNMADRSKEIQSVGRIVALSHPIDMEMQLSGEEAYHFVERSIAASKI